MMYGQALGRTIDFLNAIDLPTSEVAGATGFLPGVKIIDGRIEVDASCHVSDLLHEAGHIAIFPSRWRSLLSGNVSIAQRKMLSDLKADDVDPDDQIYRAAIQTSDVEATAWAWAAGVYLGLMPTDIILDHQYDGNGADIRTALELCTYPGIHGLAHASFCAVNQRIAKYCGLPVFPLLSRWMQI